MGCLIKRTGRWLVFLQRRVIPSLLERVYGVGLSCRKAAGGGVDEYLRSQTKQSLLSEAPEFNVSVHDVDSDTEGIGFHEIIFDWGKSKGRDYRKAQTGFSSDF